jgi:hypothetical protein
MINLNQKVEFSDSVFAQEVDGEMVLLDMESENYFGLDSVGSAIWNAIAEKKVLKDVYEKLLLEYDVEPEVLQKDLNDFVQKLVESGLVQVSAV